MRLVVRYLVSLFVELDRLRGMITLCKLGEVVPGLVEV